MYNNVYIAPTKRAAYAQGYDDGLNGNHTFYEEKGTLRAYKKGKKDGIAALNKAKQMLA